jgi:hypothetical protein
VRKDSSRAGLNVGFGPDGADCSGAPKLHWLDGGSLRLPPDGGKAESLRALACIAAPRYAVPKNNSATGIARLAEYLMKDGSHRAAMSPDHKAFLTLTLPPARLDAERGVMAGHPRCAHAVGRANLRWRFPCPTTKP